MNYFLRFFAFVHTILFSYPCFSASMKSNFVSISSNKQATFVEYKSSRNFQSEPENLHQNLRKIDATCEEIFSFYANANHDEPKIVTKKENMVFLFSETNKLEPLGSFLPPESKDLSHMEGSVADGKLLFGFKNKARKAVAFVQDSSGVIYSVTRNSRQHYSIQTLGLVGNTGL